MEPLCFTAVHMETSNIASPASCWPIIPGFLNTFNLQESSGVFLSAVLGLNPCVKTGAQQGRNPIFHVNHHISSWSLLEENIRVYWSLWSQHRFGFLCATRTKPEE